MALTKEIKAKQIESLTEKIIASYAIVVWDYQGLKATEISMIKRSVEKMHAFDKVYKNRIAKIAFERANKQEILEYLKGPSSFLIIPNEESMALSELNKVINQIILKNKNSKIKLKAGYIENVFYDTEKITEIAGLPSKNELLSMLLSVLQANIRNLAYLLTQINPK